MRCMASDYFLDTNVVIRLVAADNPTQTERARLFFSRIERGEITVTFPEAILVEIVQVLSSRNLYALPRLRVLHILTGILMLRGVRLALKHTYVQALEVFAEVNVDFPDALLIAYMERAGVSELVTFDRDFRRFPGISSIEP